MTLYLMVSILERNTLKEHLALYSRHDIAVTFSSLAYGTAADNTLRRLGLQKTEKAVVSAAVTDRTWSKLKVSLEREMHIDLPGRGVTFIIPISSIAGKRQLDFLTGTQGFVPGEESELKGTRYELLLVISNIGYSDLVMDAARKAGAGGGTVLHAKGTGMRGSEAFFGVTLASEKEMIFIVSKTEQKNTIMKAIMDSAGIESKAQSVVFSLPVTAAAGMRFAELDEITDKDAL